MSGRKNVLPSFKFWDAADLSQATLTTSSLDITGIDNVRIFMSTTGTAVGNFDVQTSPDGNTWFSLGLSPTPVASGSADSIEIYLNQLPEFRIRLTWTKTSGTGTVTGWLTGKAI